VIFQPELRQALIRIGQSRWLAGGSRRFTEMVPAVDEAVEFLSRNQFGALIVIERGVPLGEFTRTGVPIDSIISARLLESVFWPNSPLHDLAVVVSGNRIVAANVQLPIADASMVPPRLGSRHQAAVGATVETDAIVVVVSEQTGAIRIARHGGLSEPIAYDEFARALRAALTADEDQPPVNEPQEAAS
jgi:diadenylate cyclase